MALKVQHIEATIEGDAIESVEWTAFEGSVLVSNAPSARDAVHGTPKRPRSPSEEEQRKKAS